jgi:hypothetical protein
MKTITIGTVLGNWTVTSNPFTKIIKTERCVNYPAFVRCRCSCGVERDVRVAKLRRNSRSCGCLKNADFIKRATKHGMNRIGRRDGIYRTWDGMIQRCNNQNHASYPDYGGRGIRVCDDWLNASNFIEWAKRSGHAENLQIDRIDNDLGYSPQNCRWATDSQNKRNTSQNVNVYAFGETKCLTDWAFDSRCQVTPQTIKYRLQKLKWTAEDAIARPRLTKKKSRCFIGNHCSSSGV